MRTRTVLALLCGLVSFAPLDAMGVSEASVTISATGFRNDKGHAVVVLFKGEEGSWDQSKAFRRVIAPITKGTVSVQLDAVQSGSYAAWVFQDENSNEQLDKNFLGIPSECTGVSNNPHGFMGPPRYRDAVFSVTGTPVQIAIKLNCL